MQRDVGMRFIGSKKKMLNNIRMVIENEIHENSDSFIDLFSGTGTVSEYFKPNYEVIANDQLYFSSVILKGKILNNEVPKFIGLKSFGIDDPLDYLNNENYEIDNTYFITKSYSPYKENERMYFTVENAGRIDFIRQTIEIWKNENLILETEYYYLLMCLVEAVPFISNISGTYGAYFKKWDKRSLNKIKLEYLNLTNNKRDNQVYNEDANSLIKKIEGDICYIDPPYNGRQYTSNYHVLETIARYDYPEIAGITGIRKFFDNEKSDYCKKSKVKGAFEDLVSNINSHHILLSYSSEGLLKETEIEEILKKYGKEETYKLYKFPYRKYKSKVISKEDSLSEYIFYIQTNKRVQILEEKSIKIASKKIIETKISVSKNEKLVASPLNYIGGKYRILNQILPHFPDNINTFVDLFAGGFNVGINVKADKIIANDLNIYVIELLELFQETPIEKLLKGIDIVINKYQLSKSNQEGFLRLREDYNNNQDPLRLYVLICYSFNYQLRFNNDRKYNNPFGKDRSQFSDKLRSKLIKFSSRLQDKDVKFYSNDFEEILKYPLVYGDFVYCDPPYLITNGSYNDGNRGFKNWTKKEEFDLYNVLDELNSKGVKFALSNVLSHKGRTNDSLIEWSKKYRVISLNYNYSNSSHNTVKGLSEEVLIVNY